MYEEERSVKLNINWLDILIKLGLLVLFVFLIIWLMPKTPQIDTFYDKVFNENIQTMKDAAKNYYTINRLPENIGESTRMTLQEMINNKLIIPFVDKNNKSCDTMNSYVQVTKTTDNEYALKVLLVCDNQSDYILDTIGCHSTCTNGNCEVKDEEKITQTQYQFKKLVKNNKTNYICASGYTLSGTKCYKTVESSRISATPVYYEDSKTIVDAMYSKGEESIRYVDPIVSGGDTYYSCPSGYTRDGDMCYYYINAQSTTTASSTSCPAGYWKNGNMCYYYIYGTNSTSNGYYTCPNGGTVNGSSCVLTANYNTTSGSTINATPVYGSTWKAVKTVKVKGTLTQYENATEKRIRTNTVKEYDCSTCFTQTTYNIYTTYQKSITGYTCPSGYTRNGSKCYTSGTKTCPSGYSDVNGTCTKSYAATYVAGKTTTTCPSGYTQYGDQCYISTPVSTKSGSTTYSCPTGYTRSGSKCYLERRATAEYTSRTYRCPSGYTKTGSGASTTCYKKVTISKGSYYCQDGNATLKGTKCEKITKGTFKNYSCPSGYILDNQSCYKTTNDVKNAEKKTTTTSSYTYKWSAEKSISGWTATGKTRTVEVSKSK